MNIADNIGYGLRRQGMAKAEIAKKVDEALDRIGLPGIGLRKVDQLSGGQKQRVAIARCMVLEPDVLLLDEPLGALDLKLREHMKVELKKLQSAFDTTFVYITHDQSEALVMSDQIAVMNNGRFEQMGTAQELYGNPETPFVAGFVGEANRWSGTVDRVANGDCEVVTDSGLRIKGTTQRPVSVNGRADVFVRPEAIRIAVQEADLPASHNRITGAVSNVLFNGANSRVLVKDSHSGGEIDVALPQSGEFSGLETGTQIHIGWDAAKSLCFEGAD